MNKKELKPPTQRKRVKWNEGSHPFLQRNKIQKIQEKKIFRSWGSQKERNSIGILRTIKGIKLCSTMFLFLTVTVTEMELGVVRNYTLGCAMTVQAEYRIDSRLG